MGLKLKTKHMRTAYKVACKTAPIALMVAEAVFPSAKPVRIASKVIKALF